MFFFSTHHAGGNCAGASACIMHSCTRSVSEQCYTTFHAHNIISDYLMLGFSLLLRCNSISPQSSSQDFQERGYMNLGCVCTVSSQKYASFEQTPSPLFNPQALSYTSTFPPCKRPASSVFWECLVSFWFSSVID